MRLKNRDQNPDYFKICLGPLQGYRDDEVLWNKLLYLNI